MIVTVRPDCRPFIRVTAFLLIVTAANLLAWSTIPPAIFVGRVVSTQKVNDVSIATNSNSSVKLSNETLSDFNKEKIINWETWKAEVEVKAVEWLRSNQVAKLADKVFVYYQVDWSTNFMTLDGPVVGHLPRSPLNTNKLYRFICRRLDTGADPNVFRAFEGGITPQ